MKFPTHATLEARQQALCEQLLILPDSSERLNALVAHAARHGGLRDEEKVPEHLVVGCVSQVWLVCEDCGEVCVFRSAADSALVAGLVGAMTELCSGLRPAELVDFRPTMLEAAGLWNQLSPTRQRGLNAVAQTIQQFASTCL